MKKIILIVLLIMVLINGCNNKVYHTYQLEDGTIIECATEDWWGELREISDCKDGSVIYNPRNVRKLS